VAEIDRQQGIHFDPQLVPFFHEVLPEIRDIKEQYDEPVRISDSEAPLANVQAG